MFLAVSYDGVKGITVLAEGYGSNHIPDESQCLMFIDFTYFFTMIFYKCRDNIPMFRKTNTIS